MIDYDLMEYLAGSPDAPVKSLNEILERGLYHSELEATFKLRNAPETRETEATRRATEAGGRGPPRRAARARRRLTGRPGGLPPRLAPPPPSPFPAH